MYYSYATRCFLTLKELQSTDWFSDFLKEREKIFEESRKESLEYFDKLYASEYQKMLDAFEELVLFHSHKWCENHHRPNIEPVPQNDEQIEMIKEFMKNGMSEKLSDSYDEDDGDCYIRKFDEIKWKFTPGTRKMYINKTIPSMNQLEN